MMDVCGTCRHSAAFSWRLGSTSVRYSTDHMRNVSGGLPVIVHAQGTQMSGDSMLRA